MSVKSKIVGVLRSVFGIYRDGAAQYVGQQTGSLGSRVMGGSSTSYVEVNGANVTLGSAITDVRADGFAQFTITNARVIYGGQAGAATTHAPLIVKKTGIADNTATAVITVTVPNASHAAAIKVTILSSNGGTDAFESSRVATGTVVLARTSGVDTVAAVSVLEGAQIATVGGGATHTLAYAVSAISGLSSATQTFTINLTIDDSGNVGSNQAVVYAELVNAEASGVTMAAA